ncbi:MAG: sel1 repeat family protein [Myxococcales bacterium]|nr:sel1 repeat family protein [Myxococcales bacterium]
MRVLGPVSLVLLSTLLAQAQPAAAPPPCKDAAACVNLAVEALKRNDVVLSTAYVKRACEFGSADGCAGLGKAYQTGRGTAVDLVRAEAAYRTACQGGVMNACHNLALAIQNRQMHGTLDEAIELMTRSCDRGVQASCAELPRMKAPPPPPLPICSEAAPEACFAACMHQPDLARCNDARRWGSFAEADWAKLDQRRCALKDWYACVEVGWRYERDHAAALAFKHYTMACTGGRVGCAAAARLKACKAKPRKCPKPALPAELADDGDADVWGP